MIPYRWFLTINVTVFAVLIGAFYPVGGTSELIGGGIAFVEVLGLGSLILYNPWI